MATPANLVHQTSVTTGTGDFTITAVNGKNSFNNAFGTGGSNLFDYFISNRDAAEWEYGTGHLSSSTVLVRDTVILSTNANAAVNFGAGTKDVCNDLPASKQVATDLTQTLTNKRITPRALSTAGPGATPTINTDSYDFVELTALAAAITSMTTNLSGTPTTGQKLIIRFKDNGTARAITWGASFAANGVALPTTTVISKWLTVGFIWNGSTWGCVASAQEA